MTFEEILEQAIAMLQRRERLTYRTLRLQFHLDDEHLEALKDELIYGQRVAVDEDDRVLVWTGDPGTAPPATTARTGTPARTPLSYTPLSRRENFHVPPCPGGRAQAGHRALCRPQGNTELIRDLDPKSPNPPRYGPAVHDGCCAPV